MQCLSHAGKACVHNLARCHWRHCKCHAGQRVLSADSGLATVGGAAVYGVVRAAQVRMGMACIAHTPSHPHSACTQSPPPAR